IDKAKKILINLEKNEANGNPAKIKKTKSRDQFMLFDIKDKLNEKIKNVIKEIKEIDTDRLTPIEALQKIYSLKKKIDSQN
nr:DNA mismatch repair protein MutS [Candidatus Anoxychlamydiales bacterium]